MKRQMFSALPPIFPKYVGVSVPRKPCRNLVDQLWANAANLHEERERIEKELERINADRQWVITLARQGKFTNNDMEQQLATLTLQEISCKRELSALGQTININALNNWEAKFEEYLADLQVGVAELKEAAPQSEEERHNLFLLKKQVVDTLVKRVTIGKSREITIELYIVVVREKNTWHYQYPKNQLAKDPKR